MSSWPHHAWHALARTASAGTSSGSCRTGPWGGDFRAPEALAMVTEAHSQPVRYLITQPPFLEASPSRASAPRRWGGSCCPRIGHYPYTPSCAISHCTAGTGKQQTRGPALTSAGTRASGGSLQWASWTHPPSPRIAPRSEPGAGHRTNTL